VISALGRSYEAIPLGEQVQLAGRSHTMAIVAIMASAKLLEAAIGLCAPAIVALLLADIVLGIVGRAVPQLPLYFVGMPLKALMGVGALLLSLAGLDIALQSGFRGFWDLLGTVSHLGR
jgi:flagellar biosynthesis protein FliR